MASEQDEIDNDPVVRLADGYIEMERRALQAEQQLAQARLANEMLRQDKLNAERQLGDLEGYNAQVEAQNAAMRALLERVVNFNPEWVIDGNPCLFCDANAPGGEVLHAQDCLSVQARALLAK